MFTAHINDSTSILYLLKCKILLINPLRLKIKRRRWVLGGCNSVWNDYLWHDIVINGWSTRFRIVPRFYCGFLEPELSTLENMQRSTNKFSLVQGGGLYLLEGEMLKKKVNSIVTNEERGMDKGFPMLTTTSPPPYAPYPFLIYFYAIFGLKVRVREKVCERRILGTN